MPKAISVVFAGTPDFALPSLQKLIDDNEIDVKLVITQPDKPVGRKQVITPPPVKVLAKKNHISVWQPIDINKEEIPIKDFDFLITVAYGQIINKDILNIPKIASVNTHASLLPKWRGASPMQSAMLAKEKETGISIQRMVQKLDAGPILAQEKLKITEDETIETLHDKLAKQGANLLISTLKSPIKETIQDKDKATICKKLSRKDGEVNVNSMTAEEINLRVRALIPWPGVKCEIGEEPIKLLKTSLKQSEDSFEILCKDNSILYISMLQPEGKKPMTGAEWKRGRKSNLSRP